MKQYFCVGTYTEPILFGTGEVFWGKGKGVSICSFDHGKVEKVSELSVRNPSYLCIDEAKKKIYTVNEMKEYLGAAGGGMTQVAYDDSWNMKEEYTCNVKGMDPCHIMIAPNGEFLSIANFASGSVTVVPLGPDGNIEEKDMVLFQHEGCSVHPVRQKTPHAHAAIAVPGESLLYVPDLGTDSLIAYRYDGKNVVPDKNRRIQVPAGSGPRSGIFSEDSQDFYLICEISSQIIHFKNENGILTKRGTVGTLPGGYKGDNICSDIHLTPNGSYLYASNRGHDSIACYRVEADGALSIVEWQNCRGKTPRNFAVSPDGEYLLCGNQDSDTITLFTIRNDGVLVFEREEYFETPVCIRFFLCG